MVNCPSDILFTRKTKNATPNFIILCLLLQLPIHKPVVIKLGDSSDESDKESLTPQPLFQSPPNMLGDIESFLKQARKSVDQQKVFTMSLFCITACARSYSA